VQAAIDAGRPLQLVISEREQGGTIHLSAADKHGNFAALTLTHGGSFGAQVTVEGLGLTLGHGMSRFDPRPDHPNAPGPGKRPLNNMAPCIVTRDDRAILALGGRGGRKIPNAVLGFLIPYLFEHAKLEGAMAAPRMHTEGTTSILLEKSWPEAERAALEKFGYKLTTATSATLSAVAQEDGGLVSGMR
jgi:gamma-glutamyltranspeptidase/glutathione hydrolase